MIVIKRSAVMELTPKCLAANGSYLSEVGAFLFPKQGSAFDQAAPGADSSAQIMIRKEAMFRKSLNRISTDGCRV